MNSNGLLIILVQNDLWGWFSTCYLAPYRDMKFKGVCGEEVPMCYTVTKFILNKLSQAADILLGAACEPPQSSHTTLQKWASPNFMTTQRRQEIARWVINLPKYKAIHETIHTWELSPSVPCQQTCNSPCKYHQADADGNTQANLPICVSPSITQ